MSSVPAPASADHAPPAAIELLIAGRAGPSFLLDPAGENVLGRSAEALVVLPDRLASRMHAAVRYDAATGDWTLHDLGSRNGTWLEGSRIATVALADGAVIRVGTSELVFRRVVPREPVTGHADVRVLRQGPVGHFEGLAFRRSSAVSAEGARWPMLLYQAGIRLLSARSVREVIGTALELAAEHSGASSFGWFHVRSGGLEPVCVVPPGCGLADRITAAAARHIADGQSVWLHAAADAGHPAAASQELVCVPITERQRDDACLAAAAPSGALREADFDFLVALSSLVSAACAGRIDAAAATADALDDPASLHTVPLEPDRDAQDGTLALSAEQAAEALAREPQATAGGCPAPCVADAATLRLDDWQRALVIEALRRSGGSVPNAAAELGISRATLYRKLEAYGLTRGGS